MSAGETSVFLTALVLCMLRFIVGDYRTATRIFVSDRMNEARQRRTMMRRFADYATRNIIDREILMLGKRSERRHFDSHWHENLLQESLMKKYKNILTK